MADTASARIPKKRNKEGITKADINNRDIKNLLADVNKKCLDINFHKEFTVLEVYMLHNSELQAAYIKKRAEMKEDGRNNQSLTDQLGFLNITPNQRSILDRHGLTTRYMPYNRLGKGQFGVYLNRFFDVELKKAWLENRAEDVREVAVIKYFPGKCKPLNIGDIYSKTSFVEPTPNYDSHVSTTGPQMNECTFAQTAKADIYLYEYNDDCEPVKRPRQCLPHAIIKVKMNPVQEKVTAPLPLPAVLNMNSRTAVDSLVPTATSTGASLKQRPGEATTAQAASDLSQQIPSPFLKDRHIQREKKMKSKVVNQEYSRASSIYELDERKREEMRNSYLQRLTLAKATVEAEQSKDLRGLQLLQTTLQDQRDTHSNIAGEAVKGAKEHFEGSFPRVQLDDHRLALSASDDPPIQTNALQKLIAAQSVHLKAISSVQRQSSLPNAQEKTDVSVVNGGSSKRIDPRLGRLASKPVAATLSKPDPRLAQSSADEKQPSVTPYEPSGKPWPSPLTHNNPASLSKSALKSSSGTKKLTISDYKKLHKDKLTKKLPEQNSAQSSNIPTTKAQVLPMPITSMDRGKFPPKHAVPNQQVCGLENKMVPLPSFYKEYTPDEESPYQDVDFDQFQSPVKRPSP
ncbi:hypothetical protein EGW08_015569, partial [Elysia chlorotica]